MRELSEDEIKEEAGFIERYQLWPLWPLLPVKNINRGNPDFTEGEGIGLILADNLTRLYHQNLMALNSQETIGKQLEGVPYTDYLSVEAMVRHGWIGD